MSTDPKVETKTEEVAKTPDYNFAQLRKTLEAERAEKAQLLQKMKEMESAKAPVPHDDDGDEPYIDQKTLARKMSAWEKDLEQRFEKKAEEKARELLAQDKRNEFLKRNPDFENILAPENLDKYSKDNPEEAEVWTQLRTENNFERQKLLYYQLKKQEALKKMGEVSSMQKKVDENRKNPYYIPSGSGTPPQASFGGNFDKTAQKNSYDLMQSLKQRVAGGVR